MRTGKSVPKDIDEYLANVPEPARGTLTKLRATIRAAAPPDVTEGIGYGMPMIRYKGGLVAFAAFSKHCSLFPMSLATIAALKDDLARFDTRNGTIHFPMDKPLPAALVKKLVKARVAENEDKVRRKALAKKAAPRGAR